MTLTDIVIFSLCLIILGLVMALHYRMQDASWYKAKWFTITRRNSFLEGHMTMLYARERKTQAIADELATIGLKLAARLQSRQQQLKEKAYRAQLKRDYARTYKIEKQPKHVRLASLTEDFMITRRIYGRLHKNYSATNSYKRKLKAHVAAIKAVNALQS